MRGTKLALLVLAALCSGCEERPSKVDELMSANQVRTAEPIPEPPPPASFTEVPVITVDEIGVKIKDRGATDLGKEKSREKLKEVIDAIPHKGQPVTMVVHQKAKIVDVVETVWLLGKAGVTDVVLKTKPRTMDKACDDESPPADKCLPVEITVTPESALAHEPEGCSVTSMVTDGNDVGVWGFSSTGGRKHRPGFGGPDISSAQETIEKNIKSCKSDRAFFSAAYNMPWEHAYNIGATIRFADKDNKIKQLVLLGLEPVAGRPVKLRK